MKKTYTKPQLWTESFQPADAIAGSCDIDVGFGDGGNGDANTCGYQDPNGFPIRLFNDIGYACDTQWDDGNDKGCYHIPIDGKKYFGS